MHMFHCFRVNFFPATGMDMFAMLKTGTANKSCKDQV